MRELCEHAVMCPNSTARLRYTRRVAVALCAILIAVARTGAADAAGCLLAEQGEGRVADIIDARSFRLTDGREVRLAGIEPVASDTTGANRGAALSAILAGRDVILRGEDDTPDRYGRQSAFVYLAPGDTLVQVLLLAQGAALAFPGIGNRDCAATLMGAEAEARQGKKGTWAEPTAIKNAESPDDILAGIGRFTVVEGRVLSVRQAGTTTYLNFGRNWTRDFAVTISRRILPAFASAGILLKSLENRRIRVRGWIEGRPGPRINVLRVGQIEMLGDN